MVAELQAIEAPNIFITDDIFWMDVRRGEELARQIKAAGIKKYFTVQTRTDIICKFPHLIEMWKDCGSLAIFLGLESVTDEGLRSVNKKNTASNNVKALGILKELGVKATPRTSSSTPPGTTKTSSACASGSTRPAPTTAASPS